MVKTLYANTLSGGTNRQASAEPSQGHGRHTRCSNEDLCNECKQNGYQTTAACKRGCMKGTQRHAGLRISGIACYSAIVHKYVQKYYTGLHSLPQYQHHKNTFKTTHLVTQGICYQAARFEAFQQQGIGGLFPSAKQLELAHHIHLQASLQG